MYFLLGLWLRQTEGTPVQLNGGQSNRAASSGGAMTHPDERAAFYDGAPSPCHSLRLPFPILSPPSTGAKRVPLERGTPARATLSDSYIID